MALEQSKEEWGTFGKFAFVLCCCASAAGFTAMSRSSYLEERYYIASPPTTLLGIILLATVLSSSFWLGTRGRSSESWAVLAYGSWMVVPCLMFFYIVWYSRTEMPTAWYLYVIEGTIITFLIQAGIKVALRGQWNKVGLWWLLSWVLISILAPQWNYIPVFAQQQGQSLPPVVTSH